MSYHHAQGQVIGSKQNIAQLFHSPGVQRTCHLTLIWSWATIAFSTQQFNLFAYLTNPATRLAV